MPAVLLAFAIVVNLLVAPFQATPAPVQAAETVRSRLLQAELAMSGPAEAARLLDEAQAAYSQALAAPLSAAAPEAKARADAGFAAIRAALAADDEPTFAAGRAKIWTALLNGSLLAVEAAIRRGDSEAANQWLALREFRRATRIALPGTDATRAMIGFKAGAVSAAEAISATQADLLDAYQSRLTEALDDVRTADNQNFPIRRAEAGALAQGYFLILAPSYGSQRGPAALASAAAIFAQLSAAALSGDDVSAALTAAETTLNGFRAVALSPAERSRRAGLLLQYLRLVPIEYEAGVQGGRVVVDLELHEAISFREGAAAAFADLRPILDTRDPTQSAAIAANLTTLGDQLTAASTGTPPDPATIRANTNAILSALAAIMPPEWQGDATADFDTISTLLDQLESAVAAGQYAVAEDGSVQAHAVVTDHLGNLRVQSPELYAAIDAAFQYGPAPAGLQGLLRDHAPLDSIRATRAALDDDLAAARQILAANPTPDLASSVARGLHDWLGTLLFIAAIFALCWRNGLRFEAIFASGTPVFYGVRNSIAATQDGASVVVVVIGFALSMLAGALVYLLLPRLVQQRIVGATICATIAAAFVGATIYTLQTGGIVPASLIANLALPGWVGYWLGIHLTWVGLGAQIVLLPVLIFGFTRTRRRAAPPAAVDAPAVETQLTH